MVRISCIRPERIKQLLDGKEVDGVRFKKKSELGLQVTFDIDSEEEEDVEKKLKGFLKQDEILRGLIVGIEFVE